MKHLKLPIAATIIALLSACGGGNKSSNTTVIPTPPANVAPVVNAGESISVYEQTLVTLNPTATDPDGRVILYRWTQTAGPSITLNNPDTAQASFQAPAVNEPTIVSFNLQVTDSGGATSHCAATIH